MAKQGKMKKYKDKNWLYQKYHIEQLSLKAVGKLCGVHHTCIYKWLKKYQIERRKPWEHLIGKPAWNSGLSNKEDKRILSGKQHGMWGRKHSVKSKKISGEKIKNWYINNPKFHRKENNPFYGKKHSENTIQKIKNKLNLKNNPNWKGGLSFESYGIEFNNELKEQIRKRDKFICQICGIKQNGRAHDVHHIDYNKKNNSLLNLITLCHPCHLKTNYKREYWNNYLKAI